VATARTLVPVVLVLGLVPCLASAQTVVVRHDVQAVVLPLAAVRDSGWAKTNLASDSGRWTWTAELRANSESELQVLGPDVDDSVAHVRVGSGPWVRLQPRVWNAVSTLGPGTRRIAIEYSAADSGTALGPPNVRIR